MLVLRYGCVVAEVAGAAAAPFAAAGVAGRGAMDGEAAVGAAVDDDAVAPAVPPVAAGAAADEDVAAGVAAARVTGVMVTPTTSPESAAFCFLLVVPRARRVALAFAVASARAATDRG